MTTEQEKAIREAAIKAADKATGKNPFPNTDAERFWYHENRGHKEGFEAGALFGVSLSEKELSDLRRKLEIATTCVEHYSCQQCISKHGYCYGYRSCEVLKQLQSPAPSSNSTGVRPPGDEL